MVHWVETVFWSLTSFQSLPLDALATISQSLMNVICYVWLIAFLWSIVVDLSFTRLSTSVGPCKWYKIRGCREVGTTFCTTPSMDAVRTRTLFLSYLNVSPGMVDCIWRLPTIQIFRPFVYGIMPVVGRFVGLDVGLYRNSIYCKETNTFIFVYYVVMTHIHNLRTSFFEGSRWWCTVLVSPLLVGVWSDPVACRRDIASVLWSIIPTQCNTSNENHENHSCQHATSPMESDTLIINLSALWSVQKVNCSASKYGQISNTTHTIARRLLCVKAYARSSSINERYRWPIALYVPSVCSCSSIQPIWLSHESVSTYGHLAKWKNQP